jgi:hypothetical protein
LGALIVFFRKPYNTQFPGEQNLPYHVQALFYGHDHVFTDIPADGIHYTCVGSAGAPWKFDRKITGYHKFWTSSGFTWVDVREDQLKIKFHNPGHLFIERKSASYL